MARRKRDVIRIIYREAKGLLRLEAQLGSLSALTRLMSLQQDGFAVLATNALGRGHAMRYAPVTRKGSSGVISLSGELRRT